MRLRVVPPASTDDGCAGCTRRAVLRGIAITTASALVGCGAGSPDTIGPDASSTGSMCGANLCLDLGDPRNAALTAVGGTLVVAAPRDAILLIRTSATTVQAVSDICTHAGCGVSYDHVNQVLSCPCHGSKYTLDGMVVQGPAIRQLAKYQAQLDSSANLLTILL
jgi:Rieske Fe-S protein